MKARSTKSKRKRQAFKTFPTPRLAESSWMFYASKPGEHLRVKIENKRSKYGNWAVTVRIAPYTEPVCPFDSYCEPLETAEAQNMLKWFGKPCLALFAICVVRHRDRMAQGAEAIAKMSYDEAVRRYGWSRVNMARNHYDEINGSAGVNA